MAVVITYAFLQNLRKEVGHKSLDQLALLLFSDDLQLSKGFCIVFYSLMEAFPLLNLSRFFKLKF